MRLFVSAILALGGLVAAGASPVLAAAAPGPVAKEAIQNPSQVEKAGWRHRHGFGRGFGGFGLYVGPRWGGYYGSPYYSYDPYDYDDDYYSGPSYYYPSYRYRRWGHRRAYGRHWGHRHRGHHHHRRHR